MNIKYIAISVLLLAGCAAQSDDFIILQNTDITGDGVADQISIKPSTIHIADDFADVYADTFTELYIQDANNRKLLTIDNDGVIVENGDKIRSEVSSQAAYALRLNQEDFMVVVQIDDTGNPVSEPLTINWDSTNQSWLMQ